MEYVAVDDSVTTSGDMTVAEIVADVSDGAAAANEDLDADEDPNPKILNANEVWERFKDVKNFLLTEELDESTLHAIQKVEETVLDRVVQKATKQTKITDFFNA